MTDIVERLRGIDKACRRADGGQIHLGVQLEAAASEIERLRGENAALRDDLERASTRESNLRCRLDDIANWAELISAAVRMGALSKHSKQVP